MAVSSERSHYPRRSSLGASTGIFLKILRFCNYGRRTLLDELLTQCRLQGNQDADGFVWISGLHVHGRAWAFRQERGELAVRFHGRYGERRLKRAAASAICDALPGSGDLEGWVRLALCVLIDADADEVWE